MSSRHVNDIKKTIFEKGYRIIGWNKVYINKMMKKVPAYLWETWYDEDYRDVDVFKSLVTFMPAISDFESIFKGMRIKYIRKFRKVIEPLVNTCYSSDQLRDMLLEYACGQYAPIGLPGKAYLFGPL